MPLRLDVATLVDGLVALDDGLVRIVTPALNPDHGVDQDAVAGLNVTGEGGTLHQELVTHVGHVTGLVVDDRPPTALVKFLPALARRIPEAVKRRPQLGLVDDGVLTGQNHRLKAAVDHPAGVLLVERLTYHLGVPLRSPKGEVGKLLRVINAPDLFDIKDGKGLTLEIQDQPVTRTYPEVLVILLADVKDERIGEDPLVQEPALLEDPLHLGLLHRALNRAEEAIADGHDLTIDVTYGHTGLIMKGGLDVIRRTALDHLFGSFFVGDYPLYQPASMRQGTLNDKPRHRTPP